MSLLSLRVPRSDLIWQRRRYRDPFTRRYIQFYTTDPHSCPVDLDTCRSPCLPPSRDVLVDASSQVSHERREARSVVRLAHARHGVFVGVRDELPPRKFVADPSCCTYGKDLRGGTWDPEAMVNTRCPSGNALMPDTLDARDAPPPHTRRTPLPPAALAPSDRSHPIQRALRCARAPAPHVRCMPSSAASNAQASPASQASESSPLCASRSLRPASCNALLSIPPCRRQLALVIWFVEDSEGALGLRAPRCQGHRLWPHAPAKRAPNRNCTVYTFLSGSQCVR